MGLNKGKKIVLLSSGQPSLNPRLVKEADALAAAGYAVTVIYAYWNDWGTRYDEQLLNNRSWTAIRVAGDPDQRWLTFAISRLLFKLSRRTFAARSTWFLIKESKRHQADLYIAHNLGALPAAVKAAKKYGKPSGFDAEDFHRNEVSDEPDNQFVKLATRLEEKYIPQLDYMTASSPQIAEAYQRIFPAIIPVTILNVFPKENSRAAPTLNTDGTIKLFWFSQTVGTNRGLVDITSALSLLKNKKFELHLLGNCSEQVKDELQADSAVKIHFYEPIPPEKLAEFASRFDIGLALEPGFNINNNLALSNKIFTYLQAGLCVIASDTEAQRSFMDKYPAIGKVYPKRNAADLSTILTYYDNQREQLQAARLSAWSLARNEMNWETEQEKFLAIVDDTLNKQ